MRSGDFSELLAAGRPDLRPAAPRALVNGVIVRDPFPGNIIPANRINPCPANVLSFYPLPNQAGNRRLHRQLLRRAALDLRLRLRRWPSVDHEWTHEPPELPALHPQLPPRGALQLGGRAERHRHLPGRHRPLQLERRPRPHRGPGAHRWSSTCKASFLRFNDDQTPAESSQTAGPGRPRLLARHGRPLPRLLAHPDVQPRRQRATARPSPTRATRCSAWAATRTGSTPAASSRSTTSRSRPTLTKTRGQPHPQGRLRLAQPPPERGQRGLPGRRSSASTAPTRGRPATPPAATARASPPSCWACPPTTRSSRTAPRSPTRW